MSKITVGMDLDNSLEIHWKRSRIFSYQKSLTCAKTHLILDTQAFGGCLGRFLGKLSTESACFGG
jgi:hypothetical protein